MEEAVPLYLTDNGIFLGDNAGTLRRLEQSCIKIKSRNVLRGGRNRQGERFVVQKYSRGENLGARSETAIF